MLAQEMRNLLQTFEALIAEAALGTCMEIPTKMNK